MQRHRKEQPLRRLFAALERAHELLVQHALVRRVLVDEHDAVVVLEHHVRAPQLHERRNVADCSRRRRRRRRRRRTARRHRRPARTGRRFASIGLASATALRRRRRPRRGCGRRRGRGYRPRRAAERRARVEGAERATHRRFDGALDLPAIAKAHLGLRRMHVDVDHVRGDDDVEKQRRTNAGGNRRSIRRFGGAHDSRVANRAPVHREKDAPRRRADVGRPFDEPGHVRRAAHVVDVEQATRERAAVHRGEAIAQRRRRRAA